MFTCYFPKFLRCHAPLLSHPLLRACFITPPPRLHSNFPRSSSWFLIFWIAYRLFRSPCSDFERKPAIGWNASWHGSWNQRSGNRLFSAQFNSRTLILLTDAVHYLEFYSEKTRVHALKLICSTGVSNFQTFKLLFCMYNKLRLHAVS